MKGRVEARAMVGQSFTQPTTLAATNLYLCTHCGQGFSGHITFDWFLSLLDIS